MKGINTNDNLQTQMWLGLKEKNKILQGQSTIRGKN